MTVKTSFRTGGETLAVSAWARARGSAAWLLTLTSLGLAAGCQHPGAVQHPPAVFDPAQPREAAITFPPYVVEPNDQLAVSIRSSGMGPGLELTSSTISVRSDGVIDLDQYGEMPVTGWTIPQVEDAVRERVYEYARMKGRTPNPAPGDGKEIEVTVRLLASLSKFYYVMGAVRDEGRVPLAGPTTVLDAILNAGLLSYSLPNEAYLARPLPDGCNARILKIDWDGVSKRGESQTNYQVFPGDRIIVPSGKQPGLLSTLVGKKPTR